MHKSVRHDFWEPMETAPKDGREILVVDGETGMIYRVSWDGRCWKNDLATFKQEFAGWIPRHTEEA